jgi:aldose 1-epimerase
MNDNMLNENEVKVKIFNLRCGNTLLAIMPEFGGCITRYCLKTEDQVLELMSTATQAGLFSKDPLEMGCFPLIHFSNRIHNGRFSFQGKQIKMPPNFPREVHTIHGQDWKAPRTVYEVEENRSVIAYQHFPDEWTFPYLARQIFEINGPSLTVTLQIANSGKKLRCLPVWDCIHILSGHHLLL